MADGIFNNKEVIGSNDRDLIIKTRGKVYINYGKKHLELLNNKGELNVNIPSTIKHAESIDDLKDNGFYLVDDTLYGHIGNVTIEIGSTKEKVSSDWKLKLIEIGLRYNSIKEAENTLKNGIALVEDKIYSIVNEKATPINPLKEGLEGITNLDYPSNGDIIYYYENNWKLEPYLQTINSIKEHLLEIDYQIQTIKDLLEENE